MTSSLHEILHGLAISRGRAEVLADEIEHADPQAAAVFREFAEELWDIWTKYYPVLPTNKDLALLRGCSKNESPIPKPQGNEGN